MRRPPTRTTGTAMKAALQRVEDIAAFQLGCLRLEQVPPNRLSALARYGLGTKAPKLERTPEPKRTAMLTAVMRHLEAKAIDDALDLFEILMATRLISSARRSTGCEYLPYRKCKRIATHWPDMLRVAGSLITNQVRAYDLLRMFGREGHPTRLGAAFAEYGRLDKTMHLLALVDPMDDTYRRLMNRQLTVQESRHRLARAICHGGRGQIRQAYREGQEDQLAALGLVLNAVVLWNTRYLDAAVAQLRAEGHDLKDEDVARLSPLKDQHINFLGRYQFNIAASGPHSGLRPLRDPDATEDADDEE